MKKIYLGVRRPETAKEIKEEDPKRIVTIKLDVTNPADIEKAVRQCTDVDLIISNAGVLKGGSVKDEDIVEKASPMEIAFLSKIVTQVISGKTIFDETPVLSHERQGIVVGEEAGENVVLPASSTDIRQALDTGQPCPPTFPKELQDYVRKKGLYGSARLSP